MASDTELVALQETLYRSRNPTRCALHCARRDWIIEALRRHAPANCARALEVGPGSCIDLPVLAEFGGATALRLAQWLERKLRGTAAGGLLWTQYYVARAA